VGDEETVGLCREVAKKAFIWFTYWDEGIECSPSNRNGDQECLPFSEPIQT
jgi:hypothetical protein